MLFKLAFSNSNNNVENHMHVLFILRFNIINYVKHYISLHILVLYCII